MIRGLMLAAMAGVVSAQPHAAEHWLKNFSTNQIFESQINIHISAEDVGAAASRVRKHLSKAGGTQSSNQYNANTTAARAVFTFDLQGKKAQSVAREVLGYGLVQSFRSSTHGNLEASISDLEQRIKSIEAELRALRKAKGDFAIAESLLAHRLAHFKAALSAHKHAKLRVRVTVTITKS